VKKKALAAAFTLQLLFSEVAATQFVSLGRANPYIRDWVEEGEVAPPNGTLPPTILLLSPENDTAYASNNVLLAFNVSIPESNNVSLSISEIYYRASWEQLRNTYVNLEALRVANNYTLPTDFMVNLTGVPEGPRWLEVYAIAKGFSHETRQEIKGIFFTQYYVSYKIIGSSFVNFTIDNTPPNISSLSVEDKTYYASNVQLNVIVNEPVSEVIYSLDGQKNVAVTGNTTLTDLSKGEHDVTVCAIDSAGNKGNPETVHFSIEVPEPFPTALVVASVVLAAIIVVGLLVYFRVSRKARNAQKLRAHQIYVLCSHFLSVYQELKTKTRGTRLAR